MLKKLFYLLIVASLVGMVSAQVTNTISNAASTGTTVNTLTKLTGAPSTAVIAATTDTANIFGITIAGAGTSGSAVIAISGQAPCVYDGATTANDYVQISSSTGGDCHDTGAATYPTSGEVIGRVLSTNGSGGTYTTQLLLQNSSVSPLLTTITTATKCAAAGTAANPSVVSCSAAPVGFFSCATNASAGTCVVDSTAVTANSVVQIQPDSSLGTALSVTCNTTADSSLTAPRVSARSAGTSFTITLGTFTTNPECFSYVVIN